MRCSFTRPASVSFAMRSTGDKCPQSTWNVLRLGRVVDWRRPATSPPRDRDRGKGLIHSRVGEQADAIVRAA